KVVRMTNFGAFVELDEGIEGLIHMSEFDDSQHAGKNAEDKIDLKVGETYPMRIIKLAPAERKIGLSIRALKSDEFRSDWEAYQESAGDGAATLGDHFRNRQPAAKLRGVQHEWRQHDEGRARRGSLAR